MRRFLYIVTALSLSLSTVPAIAQANDKSAVEQFKLAQKSFDDGDFEQALKAARAAYEATKSPNAHLYIARALRELGRLDEAHREMAKTFDEATTLAQSEKKYVPTRDAAAAELALLDKKVGKLVVALADPPDGAEVELNGRKLAQKELGVPLAVMPGKMTVRASAPGMQNAERSVTVAAGATETVAIALDETETAPVKPKPEPKPETKSATPWRSIGFVSAGVGVAGIAVFAVAGTMAKSKHDQLEDECGGQRCTDPKYADTVDSGKRLQTIANVGLAVGAVGVLAGGTMILLGGGGEKEKTARGPTVNVSQRGVTLNYAGVF
ncbi:MAG: PEGA domain-containing protein [Myxococcales bacterium]|nr:PEGA domain-containing protein [Myxococcales bacterium]